MQKELRCSSCGKQLYKYEAIYIGGNPICPYCKNNVVSIDIKTKQNSRSKNRKSFFNFFKKK